MHKALGHSIYLHPPLNALIHPKSTTIAIPYTAAHYHLAKSDVTAPMEVAGGQEAFARYPGAAATTYQSTINSFDDRTKLEQNEAHSLHTSLVHRAQSGYWVILNSGLSLFIVLSLIAFV